MVVREDDGEVFIDDLVEVPVQNLDQALNLVNAGLTHRQVAIHNMNETSSRSHTILHIDIFLSKKNEGGQVEHVFSRLVLADLADSERVR